MSGSLRNRRFASSRSIDNQLQAAKWLSIATNPFPDQAPDAVGFPSVSSTRTLPQVVSLTSTYTAPPTVQGAWDCALTFVPISPDNNSANSPGISPGSFSNNGVFVVNTGNPMLYSGCTVISGPSGMDWGNNTQTQIVSSNAVSIPPAYTTSQWRLCAAGYEIVNTTNDDQDGGDLCTARTPTYPVRSFVNLSTTANNQTTYSQAPCTDLLKAPSSFTSLSQFPGAIVRKAREGSYSIIAFNTVENQMIRPVPGTVRYGPQFNNGQPNGTGSYWLSSQGSTATALPTDITTTHLSGLPNNSNIVVTAHYYIERVPGPNEPTLLTLTRPSTAYDPMIMELYSRVIRDLPFDVPQSDNPLGEWFNQVVNTAKAVVPAASAALATWFGGPAAGVGAYKAVSAASDFISETFSSTPNKADDNSRKQSVKRNATDQLLKKQTSDIDKLRRTVSSLRSTSKPRRTQSRRTPKKKSTKSYSWAPPGNQNIPYKPPSSRKRR